MRVFFVPPAPLFQFTPLREGRLPFCVLFSCFLYFNSRPSARGDSVPRPAQSGGAISIHAPPRGATAEASASSACARFQFTPLREGRLPGKVRHSPRRRISIHAPPRGATCAANTPITASRFQFTPLREGRLPFCVLFSCLLYFNSRPSARGDRDFRGARCGVLAHFNSRPSARGDIIGADGTVRTKLISIHAPPRGATLLPCLNKHGTRFQFTPLREGRRARACRRRTHRHFNSRPSARGDFSPFVQL